MKGMRGGGDSAVIDVNGMVLPSAGPADEQKACACAVWRRRRRRRRRGGVTLIQIWSIHKRVVVDQREYDFGLLYVVSVIGVIDLAALIYDMADGRRKFIHFGEWYCLFVLFFFYSFVYFVRHFWLEQ